MATLITLEEPSKPMLAEAKAAGSYRHEVMGRSYDKIQIVTVREIIEDGRRLDLPMSQEVLKSAERFEEDKTLPMFPTSAPVTPGAALAKAKVRPPATAKTRLPYEVPSGGIKGVAEGHKSTVPPLPPRKRA